VSRFDRLRSLVRTAGDKLGGTPMRTVRKLMDDAMQGKVRITDHDLTRAVAHAPDVETATVGCDEGIIRVDVTSKGAPPLIASFVPLPPRFAPRGAKEITFRVEPAEAARHPMVPAVTAALTAMLARGLWGAMMPRTVDPGLPIVDREDDLVRVDLRTVPIVRALLGRGRLGLVTDLFELAAIEPRDGELRLRLRMPAIVRPT
jgi:hypothetical protein